MQGHVLVDLLESRSLAIGQSAPTVRYQRDGPARHLPEDRSADRRCLGDARSIGSGACGRPGGRSGRGRGGS